MGDGEEVLLLAPFLLLTWGGGQIVDMGVYGGQWQTWRTKLSANVDMAENFQFCPPMADNFGGHFWDNMKNFCHCLPLSASAPPLSLVMMSNWR